jgi:hypothetical protein
MPSTYHIIALALEAGRQEAHTENVVLKTRIEHLVVDVFRGFSESLLDAITKMFGEKQAWP